MSEVAAKIADVRETLHREGASALVLRGVDTFAWITGGGSNVVILTTEAGIAEVLITANEAFVLTDEIERARLGAEELPLDFEILALPWTHPERRREIARQRAGDGVIFSDRPLEGETLWPESLRRLKWHLRESEVQRYRALGEEAARAMTEAMGAATPDWTEERLAGEGARALWQRGIHPTLVLVAGDERLEKYRHPFPTSRWLGRRAMMVFCARRRGLYANLTRFVYFEEPTAQEKERHATVAEIEAEAFRASKAGAPLSAVYDIIAQTYRRFGVPNEIEKQHFGGLTGYLSREVFARPADHPDGAVVLPPTCALAWNPTLPGAKIEDTVLLRDGHLEILTADPDWPVREVSGFPRPEPWVKR